MLHNMGNHYCLRRRNLSGQPGLVYGSQHKAVCVHGSLCRGCEYCKGRLPTSYVAYWSDNVSKNKASGGRNVRDLADQGRELGIGWEPVDLKSRRRRFVRLVDGGPS